MTTLWDVVEAGVAATGIVAAGFALAGWAKRRLMGRGAPPASVRWTRIAITTVAVLVAAVVATILLGPIGLVSGLTVSAIAGLAVTLALQTTLGNIIAGFMLVEDRMLRMNDLITVSGVTGHVVRIGLVTVWLRMDDGNLAGVSNLTLLGGPMINRSARDRLKGEY